MAEGRNAICKQKGRSRNKRLSDISIETLSLEDQNNPPGSCKRQRKDETTLENEIEGGPQSSQKPADLITPAAFPTVIESPTAPGAPRILLVNQQANAQADDRVPLTDPASVFRQIFRTPPSTKTSKVFLRQGTEEYRGFDPFDRLSDEIILRIFHLLPRHIMCSCALVCRRWSRIVCDASLWRRIDMGGRPIKVGVLKILLERGVEVLRLNRSEVMGDFSSTVHGAPDPKCSPLSEDRIYRLQLLDLSMCNIQTSMVENLLQFCPHLRKISLENIPVTERLLMNLAYTSSDLDTLNLAMCEGVTSTGLCTIFEECMHLRHLNVAWTGMSKKEIRTVISNLPEDLLTLDISGNRDRITDKDIENLCIRCSSLRDLEVSDSTEITNTSIETIAEYLKSLKRISLSRCYGITPQALVNLTTLRHLTTINVFGLMRDTSLSALANYLRCHRVNKEPFSMVARPTPTNEKVIRIWNVITKEGPVV